MRGRACPFKRTFSKPSYSVRSSWPERNGEGAHSPLKNEHRCVPRGSPLTLPSVSLFFTFHPLRPFLVVLPPRTRCVGGATIPRAQNTGAPSLVESGVPSSHLRLQHGPRRFVTGSKVNLVFPWRTLECLRFQASSSGRTDRPIYEISRRDPTFAARFVSCGRVAIVRLLTRSLLSLLGSLLETNETFGKQGVKCKRDD